MKIELLYVPGCPNHASAVETVKDVLREQSISHDIIQIAVVDPSQAASLFFPGSPTVRVDGKDVEPGFNESGHGGLSCRVYFLDGKRHGVPQREWIDRAIRLAGMAADKQ